MLKAYKVLNNSFAQKACEKLEKDTRYAPTAETMLGIVDFCMDLQLGKKDSNYYLVIGADDEKLNTFSNHDLQEIELIALKEVQFIKGIGTTGLLEYLKSI